MLATRGSSETGSAGKTQDRELEKAAKFTDFLPFSVRSSATSGLPDDRGLPSG